MLILKLSVPGEQDSQGVLIYKKCTNRQDGNLHVGMSP